MPAPTGDRTGDGTVTIRTPYAHRVAFALDRDATYWLDGAEDDGMSGRTRASLLKHAEESLEYAEQAWPDVVDHKDHQDLVARLETARRAVHALETS